jgi:TP901 family phage tail tape measure protein
VAEAKVDIVFTAKDQTGGTFSKLGKESANLAKTLAVGVVGAGAAVAAGLGVAVNAAMGFEQSMSAVGAVSGATAGEMEGMSKLALQLGKDTAFGAAEAADGIAELVKGGVSIEDVMGGAAKATLDLAAAGGTDLVSAAEIASNALNTFNMSGSEMAHVADMIAGAANASAIDVNDFKFSLAASGAVAATMGVTFDDLSVAIAELGNAGIKGSDAGTSLKTMLLNLQPSTKAQTEMFKELGIVTRDGANQFFDSAGKMKSLAEVSGVLQTALAGMTEAQKINALEVMFGSDAIRAAAVMSTQGAEGFNTLAASMGKVSAEAVAAKRLDNLAGDLQALQGSAETAAISLGRAFQPALRGAAQAATEAVNAAIPLIDEYGPKLADALVQGGTSAVTFAGQVKDSAIASLNDFKTAVIGARDSLKPWADEAGPAGHAVVHAMDSAWTAADALQALLKGDFATAGSSAKASLDSLSASSDSLKMALDELKTGAQAAAERFAKTDEAQAFNAELVNLKGSSTNLWVALGELKTAQDTLEVAVMSLKAALGLQTTAVSEGATGMDFMQSIVSGLTTQLWQVNNAITGVTTVVQALTAAWNAAAGAANALAEAAKGVRAALEAIPRNVTTTITTIRETIERIVGERQHGGPVSRAAPYLVGEVGPELFVPSSAGHIVPNNRLGGVAASGATVHINVSGNTILGDDTTVARRLADILAPHLDARVTLRAL